MKRKLCKYSELLSLRTSVMLIRGLEGLTCTEEFPALWKLLLLSLHHYNPYVNIFLNISREDGENTV